MYYDFYIQFLNINFIKSWQNYINTWYSNSEKLKAYILANKFLSLHVSVFRFIYELLSRSRHTNFRSLPLLNEPHLPRLGQ